VVLARVVQKQAAKKKARARPITQQARVSSRVFVFILFVMFLFVFPDVYADFVRQLKPPISKKRL